MIKRILENDKSLVMDYVKTEPALNLFIIGDIEQFGLDVPFQEVFLQYEEEEVTACVLRYYANIVIYSDKKNFNVKEIAELLTSLKFEHMSGKKSVLSRVIPQLKNVAKVTETYFCELTDEKKLLPVTEDIHIAKIEDVEKILPLMELVDFASSNYVESNSLRISHHAGRIYFITNHNQVVASAATNIETSVSAMVGGVATHPDCRCRGYASQIVSKLCSDLLKENKKPCLFYHNPKAGSIYHRLGFKDIDFWTMVEMEK